MGQIERTFFASEATAGTESLTVIAHDNSAQVKAKKDDSGGALVPTCVGPRRHRARWVQTALDCGFVLADDILRQHAMDCTHLMEAAYKAGEEGQARGWLRRRDAANAALSPQWKAAREAQIQADIGAAFFIEAGDKAREQIAANEEGLGA